MGGKHSRANTETDRKNGRSNGRAAPSVRPDDPLADEKRQRQARLQQKMRERLRDDLDDDEDFEEIDPDEVVEVRVRDDKKKKKREVRADLIDEGEFELPPLSRRRKGHRAQQQWELDWDE